MCSFLSVNTYAGGEWLDDFVNIPDSHEAFQRGFEYRRSVEEHNYNKRLLELEIQKKEAELENLRRRNEATALKSKVDSIERAKLQGRVAKAAKEIPLLKNRKAFLQSIPDMWGPYRNGDETDENLDIKIELAEALRAL